MKENLTEIKVCLVSTSDKTGGAAIATYRLWQSLNEAGANAKMLVQKKTTDHSAVIPFSNSKPAKLKYFYQFALERLKVSTIIKDQKLRYAYSLACTGNNIVEHPAIKECDIIHLHWINFGFLSLKSIKKLIDTGKPILWTLHDMWAFTGGCHYNGSCDHFTRQCGNCPMLKNQHVNDYSFKHLNKKLKLLNKNNLWFCTPSDWFSKFASRSRLLSGKKIYTVPNTLDTKSFKVTNKINARKLLNLNIGSYYICFGAPNINDKRKGFDLLKEALDKLTKENPNKEIILLIFGKIKTPIDFPFKTQYFKYITDEKMLATIYSAADITIVPSRQETFGQTASESLACGTPVVAFDSSGVAEIVAHQSNGYLANAFDTEDLKNGILWFLNHPNPNEIIKNTYSSFLSRYTPSLISKLQMNIYKEMLDCNKSEVLMQ